MSSSPMNQPNPGIIFDTLNAFQQTGALTAAIELNLFTALGDQTLDASAIATACQTDPRGVRILCDYLAVLGFLEKVNDTYRATPTSAAFLNQDSPQYMGSVARFVASAEIMDLFRDVSGAVRKGGTLLPDGGSTKVDFEMWVEFAKSMGPMMVPAAKFIAGWISENMPERSIRVLDLAAGHGRFGIEVATMLPMAQIVAQDSAAVLAIAEENACQAGVRERFSMLPGDALSIECYDEFDCILITNYLHHYDLATCESLLKKLRGCLRPDGVVLTLDFVPDENRISPPTPVMFALTMLMTTDSGDAYTFSEYQRMFESAGFPSNEQVDVPQSPSHLIISRPH